MWQAFILSTYGFATHVLAQNLLHCTLRKPVNESACGVPGEFTSETPYAGELQTVQSVEKCASFCARRGTSCSNFYFDSSVKFCGLLGRGDYVYKRKKKSTKSFYTKDCFDCGNRCDQTVGAQLLDNGNFKTKHFGPWASEAGLLLPGNDSTFVYKKGIGDYGYRLDYLEQFWATCADRLYEISFDYKFVPGTNSSKELALSVGYDTLFYTILNGGPPPIGEWKTARAWVRQLKGFLYNYDLSLRFEFGYQSFYPVKNGGNLVDNLKVSRFEEPPQTQPGTNSVLINGDFETGKFKPWRVFGGNTGSTKAKIVSPGINSMYGLQLQSYIDTVSQNVSATIGQAYLLAFDFSATKGNEARLRYTIGRQEYRLQNKAQFNASGGAISGTYSMPFIAQASVVPVSFSLDYDPLQPLLLDNFSVTRLKT